MEAQPEASISPAPNGDAVEDLAHDNASPRSSSPSQEGINATTENNSKDNEDQQVQPPPKKIRKKRKPQTEEEKLTKKAKKRKSKVSSSIPCFVCTAQRSTVILVRW